MTISSAETANEHSSSSNTRMVDIMILIPAQQIQQVMIRVYHDVRSPEALASHQKQRSRNCDHGTSFRNKILLCLGLSMWLIGGKTMDLSSYLRMDANILLGIINEKLRLECSSLDELLATFNFDRQQLAERMNEIGYHYDPVSNQFRAN